MRYKRGLVLFLALLFLMGVVVAYTKFDSSIRIKSFFVKYDKFDGDTTNFHAFNRTESQSLSDVVLERTLYGKIEFVNDLNVFALSDLNWLVDFDRGLNISDNLIYIDKYILPNASKEVVLSFYNVKYKNPVIYKKGEVCRDCEKLSFSNEIFKFKSESFDGPYFLREGYIPPVCGDGVCEKDKGENEDNCAKDCEEASGGDSGGGGGGGGGGSGTSDGDGTSTDGSEEKIPEILDLVFYPETLEIETKKGVYLQRKISIENRGNMKKNLGIVVSGVEEFVFPEEKIITLVPGQKKEVKFDIYVSDTRPADVYVGKIKFKTSNAEKIIDTIIGVQERAALFDIRTHVLKRYVNPGNRVRANISLINMGDLRNFDVNLQYKVIDFDKNEYVSKEEQFAINRTYDNVFFLDLPRDMKMGNYVFYSTVRVGSVNATSYDTFIVEKVSYMAWLLMIVIILLAMLLVYLWYKKKREGIAIKYGLKKSPKVVTVKDRKTQIEEQYRKFQEKYKKEIGK